MLVKDLVTEEWLDEAAKIVAGEPFLNEDALEQVKALVGDEAFEQIKEKLTNKTNPMTATEDVVKGSAENEDPTPDPEKVEEVKVANGRVSVAQMIAVYEKALESTEGEEEKAQLQTVIDRLKTIPILELPIELPVRKDAIDTFNEYLDGALDMALLGGISEIYYAWVKTFSGGSWWDIGDPDQLSREDFTKVCQAFADACIALYDKLADDESSDPVASADAMRVHFEKALDIIEKGARSKLIEQISELDPKSDKKGKRHSKHDQVQMSVIHGGLLNMGYAGCSPADPDAAEDAAEGGTEDDDASGKALGDEKLSEKGDPKKEDEKEDKQILTTESSDDLSWVDTARKTLKDLGVTPDGSDKDAVLDNNDPVETQKRLDVVTAELDQAQAGSSGLVATLKAVQDELRKRVETQKAEAEAKEKSLEKVEDPLETRDKVKISTKGKKAFDMGGRLEHVPTQLIEDTDNED